MNFAPRDMNCADYYPLNYQLDWKATYCIKRYLRKVKEAGIRMESMSDQEVELYHDAYILLHMKSRENWAGDWSRVWKMLRQIADRLWVNIKYVGQRIKYRLLYLTQQQVISMFDFEDVCSTLSYDKLPTKHYSETTERVNETSKKKLKEVQVEFLELKAERAKRKGQKAKQSPSKKLNPEELNSLNQSQESEDNLADSKIVPKVEEAQDKESSLAKSPSQGVETSKSREKKPVNEDD